MIIFKFLDSNETVLQNGNEKDMCVFSASCDSLLSFRLPKVCMPGRIFLNTQYRGEKSAGKIIGTVSMIKDVFRYVYIR